MPCRPSLHKVERPHCICNMQASLSCFVTRTLSPTASPLRAAHGCFASISLVPKPPILRDIAPDRHHDLDVRFQQQTSIARSWPRAASTVRPSDRPNNYDVSHNQLQAQKKSALSGKQPQQNGELTSVPSGKATVGGCGEDVSTRSRLSLSEPEVALHRRKNRGSCAPPRMSYLHTYT